MNIFGNSLISYCAPVTFLHICKFSNFQLTTNVAIAKRILLKKSTFIRKIALAFLFLAVMGATQ